MQMVTRVKAAAWSVAIALGVASGPYVLAQRGGPVGPARTDIAGDWAVVSN